MSKRMNSRVGSVVLGVLAAAVPACAMHTPQSDEATGTIQAAISVDGNRHDVTSVYYKVVDASSDCSAAPLAETTSALEEEALPGSVLPPGSGPHAGADGLFVLPPGNYLVCATPRSASGPSQECAPTSGTVTVTSAATTEIMLVSQCGAAASGAGDVIVGLNDPPHIDHLSIAPSKFITACERADLSVTATDPDGDALGGYSWSIVSGPAGGAIVGTGPSVTFDPAGPGDYTLSVAVSDAHNAQASLSFPIHVSPCPCATLLSESFADNSQGWTLDTDWQLGPATLSNGQNYGNPDPAEDHTPTGDNGVAGVVIGGNAPTNQHGFYYLTSPTVDASEATTLNLGFWRWLNSDYVPYMQNSVEVFNGTSWASVWQSGGDPGVRDNAWTEQNLDISAFANPYLRVRFGFAITSSAVFTVSSWNLDDVTITANAAQCTQ